MLANPGGEISPEDVVGRDVLITRLWRVLGRQSVVLTAERRMGKTSVVKKMHYSPQVGSTTVYRDLENVHTADEFAKTLLRDVEEHLSKMQRTAERARSWLSQMKGLEVAGVKLPTGAERTWKSLLIATLVDLAEHQQGRMVFFWDELPGMIHNVKTREGEAVACELLDTLRAARQTHSSIRMVFTGSVSLENVLSRLKRGGYSNDPVNDMLAMEVPPLDEKGACELISRLVVGETIYCPDVLAFANEIIRHVGGMPFYIQHIVNDVVDLGPDASIANIVERALTSGQDPWHLRHYRERLQAYYLPDEQELAVSLLDALARSAAYIPAAELMDQTGTSSQEFKTKNVLQMLHTDHYIARNAQGHFGFKSELVKRWWRIDRGI